MVRRVAVTAMGVISPLGAGAGENFTSLQAGRDAVSDASRCAVDQRQRLRDGFGVNGSHDSFRLSFLPTLTFRDNRLFESLNRAHCRGVFPGFQP